MAEVNPYQKSAAEDPEQRPEEPPFDPEAAGVPRESLRVVLGLVVILGAVLGFVASAGIVSLIDRVVPISWFDFTGGVVATLIGVFVLAGASLGWLAWTLRKKRYPQGRLIALVGAGWAVGLLCVAGIVRSDSAMEERSAEAFCAPLGGVPPGAGPALDRCKSEFLRCRRVLRKQPGYAQITEDAERTMMNGCMRP